MVSIARIPIQGKTKGVWEIYSRNVTNPTNPVLKTDLKGRVLNAKIYGWTKQDIDNFNAFNDRLNQIYIENTLNGKLNPFLTQEERDLCKKNTEDYYMSTFFKVMSQHLYPDDAFKLAQEMMKENDLGLKMGAEKYLATGACKLYIKTAEELEKVRLSMIREENAIDEIKTKLDKLKEKHKAEENIENKNRIAKEYNSIATIYDTHVDVYNSILKDSYTPLAIAQNRLAKDITNKLLMGSKEAFKNLLGSPVKMPKQPL